MTNLGNAHATMRDKIKDTAIRFIVSDVDGKKKKKETSKTTNHLGITSQLYSTTINGVESYKDLSRKMKKNTNLPQLPVVTHK
jgi:23S rRNA maturation-related 3'-5' exoribonuclease YhaM